MFQDPKSAYMFALFIPVAFLSILSPAILLIALPAFLANLLSSTRSTSEMYYQYTSYPTVFVFASAVLGTKRLLSWLPEDAFKKAVCAGVLAAALISAAVYGPVLWPGAMFNGSTKARHLMPGVGERIALYKEYEKKVPPDANLVATFRFLNHMAQREEVESAHYLFMQRDNLTDKHYDLPGHIDFALFDMQGRILNWFPYDAGRNVSEIFTLEKPGGEWGIVDYIDDIVLLKRGHKHGPRMVEANPRSAFRHKLGAKFKHGLEVEGFSMDVKKSPDGFRYLAIDLYAKIGRRRAPTHEKPPFDYYLVQFHVVDRSGNPISQVGYRPLGTFFYTTPCWKPGRSVVDRMRVYLPESLPRGTYGALVSIYYLPLYNYDAVAAQRQAQSKSLVKRKPEKKPGAVVPDFRKVTALSPSGLPPNRAAGRYINLGSFELP
jgi:hypothetical protein